MSKIFIIALFLVVSVTYTPHAEAAASTTEATAVTKSTTTKLTPAEIETKVRTYFADVPVMIEIAKCESKFRQFTDAGSVFYGGAGGGMVGIFQFYEAIHKNAALALGFDLTTVDGNLGYARHLYGVQGTKPWVSCVPATVPVVSDANTELRIKLMLQIIDLLQQLIAIKEAERGKSL